MQMKSGLILQVAVPAPVAGTFDYLLPDKVPEQLAKPGARVRVSFGRQITIGVISATTSSSDFPRNRLKPILELIDDEAIIPDDLLSLLQWAASYYQHPVGEVFNTALPALLRQGQAAIPKSSALWKTICCDDNDVAHALSRAPKQAQIFNLINESETGLDAEQLNQLTSNWRGAVSALIEKKLLEEKTLPLLPEHDLPPVEGPTLNDEQAAVIDSIKKELGSHHVHLLHGITGSGKTEVYLQLSQAVLDQDKQVLVLVPEISLTPQLTRRFEQRLGLSVATLHSGLNNQQRLNAWHCARTGMARLVIGTRSSIFTPMPQLGLIIIDEEHDGSYKQQDGFRYNARDLALVKAHKLDIPVVLGSATPSLESLHNARRQRYRLHKLNERANNSKPGRIELIDMCSQPLIEGISAKLLDKVKQHLDQNSQVLLFINRRGFSPLLMCHDCGWTTHCIRCDAHMTFHRYQSLIRCHHCGAESPAPKTCNECDSTELLAIGLGTERIEDVLKEKFPDTGVNRIDRDTTRNKGVLQEKLDQVHSGETGILIGTQMLAKGHDFPNVTLVAVLDTDQALYSADFRAAEHLAQLIIQVAGRAGRAEKAGEVVIQTHHPDHPLLQTLIHQGYEDFAEAAIEERRDANFPPHSHLVLLRCEAIKTEQGNQFMADAKQSLDHLSSKIEYFGPLPAPMEKRAGRFRSQIILQSTDRKTLHQTLQQWLPHLRQFKSARKIRWSIDVDPYDTY